jgi:hypothetical protein
LINDDTLIVPMVDLIGLYALDYKLAWQAVLLAEYTIITNQEIILDFKNVLFVDKKFIVGLLGSLYARGHNPARIQTLVKIINCNYSQKWFTHVNHLCVLMYNCREFRQLYKQVKGIKNVG